MIITYSIVHRKKVKLKKMSVKPLLASTIELDLGTFFILLYLTNKVLVDQFETNITFTI